MNCIYVGFYYPDGMIEELRKLGSYIDFPGFTFQNALLMGLDSFYPNLKVVSSAFMDTYPRIKKVYFKSTPFSHKGDSVPNDIYTGILNVPGLNLISRFIRIRRALKRELIEGDENIVICYEIHTPFLLAIATLRKRIAKTCLIVPDLPEYMTGKRNVLYLLAKKIDKNLINYTFKSFDCYVLFSALMKEKLPLGDKPWIQLEGIFNPQENAINVSKESGKVVMYSGALDLRYGIKDLLEAFHLIQKSDYRLLICGDGKGKEIVLQYAALDSRISYLGVLERKEVIRLQKAATLLINPRHSSEIFTKYSFPSKTMEYLASGTPALMSHLASIPHEYDSHIFYFNDETIKGMSDRIIEICEMDCYDLDSFGRSAADFIREYKNPKKQAERVVELLKTV